MQLLFCAQNGLSEIVCDQPLHHVNPKSLENLNRLASNCWRLFLVAQGEAEFHAKADENEEGLSELLVSCSFAATAAVCACGATFDAAVVQSSCWFLIEYLVVVSTVIWSGFVFGICTVRGLMLLRSLLRAFVCARVAVMVLARYPSWHGLLHSIPCGRVYWCPSARVPVRLLVVWDTRARIYEVKTSIGIQDLHLDRWFSDGKVQAFGYMVGHRLGMVGVSVRALHLNG